MTLKTWTPNKPAAGRLIGFFHGDEGDFTGNISSLYGGTFYEIRLTEGHRKGELLLVTRVYEAQD